jgi:hypothetical protein
LQLLPRSEPYEDEGSAGESDRHREGSLDAVHIRMKVAGKNVRRSHIAQLRSNSKDDKTGVQRGRRLWKLVEHLIDERGLAYGRTGSASDYLQDCT